MTREDGLNPYARAVSVGIASGMRTMLGLAAITYATRTGAFVPADARLNRLLQFELALPVLSFAAVGELVVDKLPLAPDRLEPGPLLGRIVIGSATAAIISRGRGGSPIVGAAAGAASALASSWVVGRGRAWIGARSGLPDPVVAVGEDALAIAFAALAAGPFQDSRPS